MRGWSEDLNVRNLWELLEVNLGRLCIAWDGGKFVPLLEADVSAYLYYLFVSEFDGDASQLHLGTRIISDQKKKPDFVIGEVSSTENQKDEFINFLRSRGEPNHVEKGIRRKSIKSGFRAAVYPNLILEFKLSRGPKLLKEAKKDIEKLGKFIQDSPEGRGIVLFDEKGILTDGRRRDMAATRGIEDPKLRIYICEKNQSEHAFWTRL